ncbi:MAG: tubulin-like doman-containing protein [Caldilineaceae bacterium]
MNTNSFFTNANGATSQPNGLQGQTNEGSTGTAFANPNTIAPFLGETTSKKGNSLSSRMPKVNMEPRTLDQTMAQIRTAVRTKCPLIVVAGGGSGRAITTNLKANLVRMFNVLPENVALLAFDSGAEVVSVRDHLGRTMQLENGSEFISLGKVPIAGIKRNPDYQSEMAARLGDNLYKIYRQSIVDGCSQNRIEGIATLYYHFDTVYTALKRAIQRVTRRHNDVEVNGDDAQKLNIVFVGSAAGGQGAGVLLDLALIIRELLGEQAGWEDTAQLTGFLLLPSAFNDVKERDKRNMAPNAFAFLHELELLQRGEAISVRYPNRVNVHNIDAPFDHVYVVEGIDERGYVWSNQRDVCQMVARGIVLLTAGHVGMSEIAFALNQHSVLMRTNKNGYRSYLAAIGLSELYYPGDLVLHVALLRHLCAMIDDALQSTPIRSMSEIAGELPNYSLAQLQSALQNGVNSRVQIQLPDDLREGDVGQIPGKARDYVGRFKSKRVYELHFTQLDQRAKSVTDTLQSQFVRWLERMATLPCLPQLQQSLQLLLGQVTTVLNEVEQVRKQITSEIEHKKRTTTAADVAMVQAAESFFLGRKERTLNAVNHYADEAEQQVLLEVREREVLLMAEVLHHVEEQVQEALAEVAQVSLRLQSFANRCHAEEQRLLATPMSQNVINLADGALIDALYQHYTPEAAMSLQSALVSAEGWWKLGQQSDDALLQTLQAAASPAFEALATLNVERVLRQRWPERSAEAWVNLLSEKAAVAWNVDRAKLPPGAESLAPFLTLGVPDGENSFFAQSGLNCTTTGDPQRIIVLRTVYGGTIDSLKSLGRWQTEYQAALKAQIPLHLFGGFEANRAKVLALLGLGLLFEFLRRKQAWFVYHPQDVLEKPAQVAQGLEKTIETLTSNAALLSDLERRINARIAEIGHAKAAQMMQQWVEQYQDREDELFTAVVRAVRSYAEKLK